MVPLERHITKAGDDVYLKGMGEPALLFLQIDEMVVTFHLCTSGRAEEVTGAKHPVKA
jgi:hypothetical protein